MTEKPLRAKQAKIARKGRVPWADLLQKVFAIDVLACPDCNGRMQLIAFLARATVAKRILDHLGLDATGPPVARAAPPPEQLDLGPSYDAADPVYPELRGLSRIQVGQEVVDGAERTQLSAPRLLDGSPGGGVRDLHLEGERLLGGDAGESRFGVPRQ